MHARPAILTFCYVLDVLGRLGKGDEQKKKNKGPDFCSDFADYCPTACLYCRRSVSCLSMSRKKGQSEGDNRRVSAAIIVVVVIFVFVINTEAEKSWKRSANRFLRLAHDLRSCTYDMDHIPSQDGGLTTLASSQQIGGETIVAPIARASPPPNICYVYRPHAAPLMLCTGEAMS